jgi:hypothetical protein
MAPGWRGTEERRIPSGVYSALLQQEEHYLRGWHEINHCVLQEQTQGLVLDPQAHHEESRTYEEMLAIMNKYALAEEVTLDTREQKKEYESGNSVQPGSYKSHNKKRKANFSVNNVEWPRHNKEYQPRPGEFDGFLDQIYILYPEGMQKTRDSDWLQGFAYEVLKTDKKADQEKKPNDPKGDFLKAHNEINYIYGRPNPYTSSRKQKLTTQVDMAVSPPPSST